MSKRIQGTLYIESARDSGPDLAAIQDPSTGLSFEDDGSVRVISRGSQVGNLNDLSHLAGVVAGTVTGSRAVVVDANKDVADLRNLGLTGALLRKGGAATPAVVDRWGDSATEGLEVRVIDETVACGTAAASHALTSTVPAGAVILSVQANLQTAVTVETAVKVGIGVTADPDKYGKTSGVTKNLKVDTVPDWAVLSSAETVAIFATDTVGAAAGTIGGTGEAIRVRIVFLACNSLDDAA